MRTHTRRRHKSKKTRRNKRRQYGKGVFDNLEKYIEPITMAIQRTFPEYQYKINPSPTEDIIRIDIYCPNDEPMILLWISDNEMYIDLLARCTGPNPQSMRGTDILKGIIAMGNELKSLGIKQLRLADASTIHYPNLSCTTSLAGYLILTSDAHHSWYNSYGFKSDNYESEVKTNTLFSQQPMMDLLRMIYTFRITKKKNPLGSLVKKVQKINWRTATGMNGMNGMNGMDGLVKELIGIYEGNVTPDMSIQEGIRRIHDIAHQALSCKSPKIIFYQDAMKAAFEYGIQYNNTDLIRPL